MNRRDSASSCSVRRSRRPQTRRDFTASREYLLALRFRSLGERVAQEMGTRRGGLARQHGRAGARDPP